MEFGYGKTLQIGFQNVQPPADTDGVFHVANFETTKSLVSAKENLWFCSA